MYCTSVMLIPWSRLRRGPRRLPTNDEHPTTSNKMHSDSVTSDSRELLSRTRFSQSPAIKIHEFCTRKLGPLWGAQNANPSRQTTSATSKQIRPEQNGPIPAATLYPTPAASRQSPVPSRQSPAASPQPPVPSRQSPVPSPQPPVPSPQNNLASSTKLGIFGDFSTFSHQTPGAFEKTSAFCKGGSPHPASRTQSPAPSRDRICGTRAIRDLQREFDPFWNSESAKLPGFSGLPSKEM
jgi:hypothetical protein